MTQIQSIDLRSDQEVVLARQQARQIAQMLGFGATEQTRMAGAVSEIARNVVQYAGEGAVSFSVTSYQNVPVLEIQVRDHGPGIPNLIEILEGRNSRNPESMGISRARSLTDHFRMESTPGKGTSVFLAFELRSVVPREELDNIVQTLATCKQADPYEEIKRLGRELSHAMDQIARQEQELTRMNQELVDTNRGVVALYAELDEKAENLRQADELKSRFLSNMSHEFRTPLNSILALAGLLLNQKGTSYDEEQVKQIEFIRKAAQDLTEMVNDLLDLAKIEAGKADLRPSQFTVADLFGALRGMFRPVLTNPAVALTFQARPDLPPIFNDEGKVSQILRNFISNALKFTEKGEVRVSAELQPGGREMLLSVTDTGIGIEPEHQKLIFQEFVQLPSHLQRRAGGTGLGLALCRRLADILGGKVAFNSTPGQGSTFSASIPIAVGTEQVHFFADPAELGLDRLRFPVLLVEPDRETAGNYDRTFRNTEFELVPVQTTREAITFFHAVHPVAVLVDLSASELDAWNLVASLKMDPEGRGVPLLLLTDSDLQRNEVLMKEDRYCSKQMEPAELLEKMNSVVSLRPRPKLLLIDDEEADRSAVRANLVGTILKVIQASNGVEALKLAADHQPQVVVLDLNMPDMDGFQVLERLRSDPKTAGIPVIINSSRILQNPEAQKIAGRVAAILSKHSASRADLLAAIRAALPGESKRASGDEGPP